MPSSITTATTTASGSDSSPSSTTPLSALSKLSRNTSVISSSSSSSSVSLNSPSHPPPTPSSARLSKPRPPRLVPASPRSPGPTPPQTPRAVSDRHLSTSSAATARPGSRRGSTSTNATQSSAGISPRDFQIGRILGTGSYSIVNAAYLPHTHTHYAIKICDKSHILRYQQQGNKVNVAAEKKALATLAKAGHPGVVRLHWALQDTSSLYFVLELCPKGDMSSVLRRLGSFSLRCATFYFAQLIDAVFFMHSHGVIHRDLKPDNVLFTADLRIKITDFGSAKVLDGSDEDGRRSSFVGSPQYVSPEILAHAPVTPSTDLWSLGIILYQMLSGRFPFEGPAGSIAHYLMWQKVQALDYSFGPGWEGEEYEPAKDCITKLLLKEPERRLGAGGYRIPAPSSSAQDSANSESALRQHSLFTALDWSTLWTCTPPPFERGMAGPRPEDEYEDEELGGEDVGRAWDALVGGGGESDEMDEEGTEESHEGIYEADARRREREMENERQRQGERETEREKEKERKEAEAEEERSTGDGGSDQADSRSSGSGGGSWPITLPNTPHEKWSALFRSSESALFFSPVQTRARALLPAKRRLLVLTDAPRLMCVKEGRDRASVQIDLPVTGLTAELKGERAFVVTAPGKSYQFTTDPDGPPAARWVREIRDAQSRPQSQLLPRTPSAHPSRQKLRP